MEASLEAIRLTGSSSLEDGKKLKDSESTKMTEDDTNQKDSTCEDKSCISGPNDKLNNSSERETVDSKMKAAATGIAIDSGSKKFRYYGAGVGTFLT